MPRNTTIDRLFQRAKEHPERAALFQKQAGTWQSHSWLEYAKRVKDFAQGLIALGHQLDEKVPILGFNCLEWCIADLAVIPIHRWFRLHTLRVSQTASRLARSRTGRHRRGFRLLASRRPWYSGRTSRESPVAPDGSRYGSR